MRDQKIDVLRFIGLAMIILAHTSPPAIIFQIRNFDVPLMVIVSAFSFSIAQKNGLYLPYIWKRIKRLVLPVWLFLTIYFLSAAIIGRKFNEETILSSFLLLDGIGYVWIIRVFIMVACIAPAISIITNKISSNKLYIILVLATSLVCELLINLSKQLHQSNITSILNETLFLMIPYGILFSIGIRIKNLNEKELNKGIAVAFSTFIITLAILCVIYGEIKQTQNFKYPPQIYYTSYAVFVSVILWKNCDIIIAAINKIGAHSMIEFIGKNSIWIYLWHIPAIQTIKQSYYIKYPLTFTIATMLTWIQIYILTKFILPKIKNESTRSKFYNIFTG